MAVPWQVQLDGSPAATTHRQECREAALIFANMRSSSVSLTGGTRRMQPANALPVDVTASMAEWGVLYTRPSAHEPFAVCVDPKQGTNAALFRGFQRNQVLLERDLHARTSFRWHLYKNSITPDLSMISTDYCCAGNFSHTTTVSHSTSQPTSFTRPCSHRHLNRVSLTAGGT